MTKKDLTTLLIAFGGGWLLVLGVIASLAALPQIAIQLTSGFRGGAGPSLVLAGLALLPILFYGGLGWYLIRRSASLAERLLGWAQIDGTAIIQGAPVAGLAPVLFSLLGLYFLVNNLPSFLQTAYRWFTLEAATNYAAQYIGTDIETQRAGLKSELTYYILTIGIATFVLLRSTWIARQATRFSERDAKK